MSNKKSDSDIISDQEDVTYLVESDFSTEIFCDKQNTPEVSTNAPSAWHKYKPSLKTLIPVRHQRNITDEHPSDTAGLLSTAVFSWMTALIWNIYKNPESIASLWKVSKHDEAEMNYKRLAHLWKGELKCKGHEKASVWRVSFRFLRFRLALACIFTTISCFASFFTSSIVIRLLLSYVSQSSSTLAYGFTLLATLVATELIRSFAITFMFAINYRSAIRLRSALLLLLFKKVLKLAVGGRSVTVGDLINLCSNDGDRIFEAIRMGLVVIMGPIAFVSGTVYSYFVLGPTGLVGSGIFLLMIPIQGVIARITNNLREKSIHCTQERVKTISEILTFIKLIKLYCWELPFSKKVEKLRLRELWFLKLIALTQSINISLAFLTPVVAAVVVLSIYVLSGNNLDAERAFTCVAIFNAMSYALKMMPIAVRSLAEFNVAVDRFQAVLTMENIKSYVHLTCDEKNAIEIENASFLWGTQKHEVLESAKESKEAQSVDSVLLLEKNSPDCEIIPVLKNINFSVSKGSLVGICGPVGSGKTSLVSAILGHMHITQGSVGVNGTIAYAAQEAWLMNSTVRDNIIFGTEFDMTWYNNVIFASGLTDDFAILPSGDLTEVGDRGINLSGGQKQRISLARALYSNRDIYLLDDPLSALDIHVGKHIFNEAILEQLKKKGKTVVLLTHHVQFLPKCDQVFVMNNGEIKKSTDFESINKSTSDMDGLEVLESNSSELEQKPAIFPTKTEEELLEQGKLIGQEEGGSDIPWSSYSAYLTAASGWFVGALILLFFWINVGVQQFSNLWLSYWLNQGSGQYNTSLEAYSQLVATNSSIDESFSVDLVSAARISANSTNISDSSSQNILLNPNFRSYLLIYGMSAVFMLIASVLRGLAFMSYTFKAMYTLHNQLLNQIVRAPMSFFDTTPAGRIINRFQKDVDEADGQLPLIWEMFFFNFMTLIFALGLVAFVFPWFLFVVAVIIPLLLLSRVMFKPAAREMKRLDALSRSPWFSHIRTTVTGLETIRAYQRSSHFVRGFIDKLNDNASPCYLFACVNRWLAIRLDLMMIVICVFTALFVILNRGVVTPAFAGLALMSAFLMSGLLQFTVRLLIEGDARFIAVDRIKYYIDNTPQEQTGSFEKTVVKDWPVQGQLEFRNVSMRYRDGLPLALQNISFKLKPNEKIGVVGRTGSGKSSLAVSLFRLVELSEGCILIDGNDIGTMPLYLLRSSLSIIPQDPVLFTGTVRYNLDPFDQHNDKEIWNAIKHTHLDSVVLKLPGKLESPLSESGSNLSLGERQLVCLARALLRNSKILVLDEATAAVDNETEKLVQETLQKSFANCTLIVIAHRLSSVLSSDRVLVMSNGDVVEFDTPDKLLENKDSVFAQMISAYNSD